MKKNFEKISFNGVTSLLLLVILTACNSQPSSSSKEVKAPDQDLHAAVITGNLEAIQQHIQAGSDLNIPDPFGGSSPLITAALFGKKDIAKALLDGGAKINFSNNEGSTALHTAAFFCEKEIVSLLLENGANKNMTNNYGSTALQSVQGSFDEVKGIYVMMEKQLSPMGFSLDLAYIEQTRPEIVNLLQ